MHTEPSKAHRYHQETGQRLENTGGPAKNQEASVPAVSDEVSPVRASLVTRSSWVGGVVPNEISETMFRRLSAMGAGNTRDGT
jgi:hypothetical protein